MTGTDLCVNKPHCAAAVWPWESEATTSTLPPARVRTCSSPVWELLEWWAIMVTKKKKISPRHIWTTLYNSLHLACCFSHYALCKIFYFYFQLCVHHLMCHYIIHALLHGFSRCQFDILEPRRTLVSSIAGEIYIRISKKVFHYFTICSSIKT